MPSLSVVYNDTVCWFHCLALWLPCIQKWSLYLGEFVVFVI